MEFLKFYKQAFEWLEPIGFIESYSNHPSYLTREVHFSKDGIRVICIWSVEDEYCYLHADILSGKIILSLRTQRYPILTKDFESLLTEFTSKVNLLKVQEDEKRHCIVCGKEIHDIPPTCNEECTNIINPENNNLK